MDTIEKDAVEELCYGIVPLRFINNRWQILLLHHAKGSYWAFPKGHFESSETAKACAARELYEETHLTIKEILFEEKIFWEKYSFQRNLKIIFKRVGYFAAIVDGEFVLQKEEIVEARWFTFKEALKQISFPQSKSLCKQIMLLLT